MVSCIYTYVRGVVCIILARNDTAPKNQIFRIYLPKGKVKREERVGHKFIKGGHYISCGFESDVSKYGEIARIWGRKQV